MGAPSDPTLFQATIEGLEAKATYVKENGADLQEYTGLVEFLKAIKKIKNETTKQIKDAETKEDFIGFMEEAEDIIFDLQTRLRNEKLDGYGKRRRALANALKSAAGILKIIAAIILVYHDSM